MRQNLVSPRTNRTFEQKRGDKATKLKKYSLNKFQIILPCSLEFLSMLELQKKDQ